MQWSDVAWRDGELVPTESLALPGLSLAALYGLGLFETLRVYGGRPFALDRHLRRMGAGAAQLDIATPHLDQPDALAGAIGRLLSANALSDAALRITLAATGDDWDDPRPTLTLTVRPFSGYPPEWYEAGIRLAVAPWHRCAEDLHVPLKSANYLTCIAARRYAQQHGAQEALLLNCEGRVAEGSASNVFIVGRSGDLQTPALAQGLLPGVTREIVLELAAELGIGVREERLRLAQFHDAPEVFVTSSLMEIVPVSAVEGVTASACPGETTTRVAQAYREPVARPPGTES